MFPKGEFITKEWGAQDKRAAIREQQGLGRGGALCERGKRGCFVLLDEVRSI